MEKYNRERIKYIFEIIGYSVVCCSVFWAAFNFYIMWYYGGIVMWEYNKTVLLIEIGLTTYALGFIIWKSIYALLNKERIRKLIPKYKKIYR